MLQASLVRWHQNLIDIPMSDKRSQRNRRRRGDADDFDPSYTMPEFRARSSPPAAPSRSSETVQAVVKWFDPVKGFGFVVANGSEAFLHVSRLKSAGYSDDLPEGSQITVRLGPGKRGPEVTELVEVCAAGPSRSPKQGPGGRSSAPDMPEEELVGSVKWYNSSKGFGFVAVGEGRKDVFVPARALERSGLSDLQEGRKVKMKVVQNHKGPEARSIQFLD